MKHPEWGEPRCRRLHLVVQLGEILYRGTYAQVKEYIKQQRRPSKMKIESVKVNFAVADRISRKNILEMLSEIAIDPEVGFYGVEIEEDGKNAEEAPRKKRKYTRHVKPTEGDSEWTTTIPLAKGGVNVTRRKMADGTIIEQRGNCQGGGTV